MLIRRFLLLLFTLLQCFAPLLHAHASGPAHSGIHLPTMLGDLSSGHQLTLEAVPESPPSTVASSLQARDVPPLTSTPILAFQLPGIGWTLASPWTPALNPRAAARFSQHLIPLPGAPPQV